MMKKTTILTSISFIICQTCFAQRDTTSSIKRATGVSIFLKSGTGWSQALHRQYRQYEYTEQSEQININAFTINLGAEFHLGKTISTQTGINYFTAENQINYTFERGKGYPDYYKETNDYTVSYSYIQIPIILKINFGKKVKYYISGGMVLGFLANENIKGKRIWDGPDYNAFNKHVHKEYIGNTIKTNIHNEDGVITSLGIEIPLNKNYFLIELFARKGLHTYNYSGYWKNNFGINIGYRFVLSEFSKEKI